MRTRHCQFTDRQFMSVLFWLHYPLSIKRNKSTDKRVIIYTDHARKPNLLLSFLIPMNYMNLSLLLDRLPDESTSFGGFNLFKQTPITANFRLRFSSYLLIQFVFQIQDSLVCIYQILHMETMWLLLCNASKCPADRDVKAAGPGSIPIVGKWDGMSPCGAGGFSQGTPLSHHNKATEIVSIFASKRDHW